MATTETLRKAAVLVASLDRDTADALLDQMPDEHAAQIRQMIIGIDTVSDSETHTAIEDFLGVTESDDDTYVGDSVVETAFGSTLVAPITTPLETAETVAQNSQGLDEHLANASDKSLIELLSDEQSQTIAVVLARVSAERASGIVARLPIEKQADVLQRIVEADRLSTRLDDAIAEEFESWLIGRLESAKQRSELVSRLSKIVGAAPPETQQRILANLATSDVALSRELGYDGETTPLPMTADH